MEFRSDEVIIKEFGNRLQQIRTQKGYSLRELAHLADLSHNAIHEIEKGIVDTSLTTIVRLAEALGIDPAELMQH
jgi:transcriptional regulator with XRE-family HTH domain